MDPWRGIMNATATGASHEGADPDPRSAIGRRSPTGPTVRPGPRFRLRSGDADEPPQGAHWHPHQRRPPRSAASGVSAGRHAGPGLADHVTDGHSNWPPVTFDPGDGPSRSRDWEPARWRPGGRPAIGRY